MLQNRRHTIICTPTEIADTGTSEYCPWIEMPVSGKQASRPGPGSCPSSQISVKAAAARYSFCTPDTQDHPPSAPSAASLAGAPHSGPGSGLSHTRARLWPPSSLSGRRGCTAARCRPRHKIRRSSSGTDTGSRGLQRRCDLLKCDEAHDTESWVLQEGSERSVPDCSKAPVI